MTIALAINKRLKSSHDCHNSYANSNTQIWLPLLFGLVDVSFVVRHYILASI